MQRALAERQLRAILRAGAVGPLKVMFPMVGTPEEARELRALVEKVKGLLAAEGVAHDPEVPVAYAQRYAAWQAQFNRRDDGHAAERVVSRILDQGWLTA